MKQYSLTLPGRIFSGDDALGKISEITKGRYRKAAVFTDQGIKKSGLLTKPLDQLQDGGLEVVVFDDLAVEPDYRQAQKIIDRFKLTGADLIVAIGGGSVMDVAKLASIAATDDYGVKELLADPLLGTKTIPTLMIPTTAGTGAEATVNSIVAVPEEEVKIGIVNPQMMPDYVILDSRMIKNLPVPIAAATGIDALAHAIECYTSNKANPFSNLFALEALKLIFADLEAACTSTEAAGAKTNMLRAAFYAGIAISSSGTTAVHALSYPLGGKYHIPHGVANAMLLLPVMKFNQEMCTEELAEVFEAITPEAEPSLSKAEKAGRVIDRMGEMISGLPIPHSLSEYGIGKADLPELIRSGLGVRRLLDNNKKFITYEDARQIYLEIM